MAYSEPSYLEKFEPILSKLQAEDGRKVVAVITMTGSCCPITRAHCMMFETARETLLNGPEKFGEILGLLSLNSDSHVIDKKMSQLNEKGILYKDRSELAKWATAEMPWMDFNPGRARDSEWWLPRYWKGLTFIRYEMNGADDVLKFEKWKHCKGGRRFITMGRPGFTEEVTERSTAFGVDLKNFIIAPELPNISSTKVRKVLREEHGKPLEESLQRLGHLLHPSVAEWLLKSAIYVPESPEFVPKVSTHSRSAPYHQTAPPASTRPWRRSKWASNNFRMFQWKWELDETSHSISQHLKYDVRNRWYMNGTCLEAGQ